MKKSILILAATFLIGATLTSCKKEKAIEPVVDNVVAPTITTDTLGVKVFFSDNINFAAADYTVTVVDVTDGDNSTVFVDSVVLNGVVAPSTNAYSGNVIKLPRTAGVDRVYKVYLGGRKLQGFVSPPSTQTITVISGNVKNVDDATNNTSTPTYIGQRYTWGYGEIIVKASGVLESQPHPSSAFSEFDPVGTYVVF